MTDDDELARSRADFEAKVRASRAPAPAAPGGKGSPPALLAIGLLGSALLAATAALLGGGLLYLPAAVPLATVLLVLASRARAGRVSS